jgi:acyl carrier protein
MSSSIALKPIFIDKIQHWFIQYLANKFQIPENQLKVSAVFHDYGIDSLKIEELVKDIADKFNLKITPLDIYDYPTIEQSSENLANLLLKARSTSLKILGEEVFGDAEITENWFAQSNPALGNKIPNELLGTLEGEQAVSDLLMRIEYGVYS